ncbi:MAG: DUF4349 domain-containing protein [Myxococcales bacterium]|nr:DUF4349 domain-containing protein [Myxococcales bacterium]
MARAASHALAPPARGDFDRRSGGPMAALAFLVALALWVTITPASALATPPSKVPAPPATGGQARGPGAAATDPQRPTGDQTATDPAGLPKGPAAPAVVERLAALQASVTLKVVHPDAVRAAVIAKTRELGGFPTLVSDGELQLKVPPTALPAILEHLCAAGIVLEKSLNRADRTEAIAQLDAKVRSKHEIFQRLRSFIDDSNVSATLRIERSMTQLVGELEALKGEAEVERESVRWAVVRTAFQFHREGRLRYVRSPFEWLNSVELGRFLAGFDAR